MFIDRYRINHLHWALIALSLVLASWINYIQHGWINNDSVIYLESARLFSQGLWQAGLQIWAWPLFPLLIAGLHKISGLDLHNSAQILNTALFGLTTASFLQIIREAGGKQITLLCAALVLFSSNYIVGDVLPMLLRDQGFWAFFLTALVFLLRYSKHPSWTNALLWQACIIIATLFRIEAITYLLLLPTALWFIKSGESRLAMFIRAHSINIMAAFGLLLAIVLMDIKPSDMGRLQEVLSTNLYQEMTQKLFEKSDVMARVVLGKYLEEYALPGLFMTFAFVIIAKTLLATGYINTVLAYCALRVKPSLLPNSVRNILNLTMLISLLNMCLIVTKVFVLSGRYVIAFSLMLLLYAAIYLAYFLERYQLGLLTKPIHRVTIWAVVLIMLISLINNVWPKARGFNYEQEAVAWLSSHHIDRGSVFFDSSRLRYYAEAPYTGSGGQYVINAIHQHQPIMQSYVLMSINKKHPQNQLLFEQTYTDFKQVASFDDSKHKKSIVIYQHKNAPERH